MSTVPFFYQHFHDLAGHLAAGGSMHVYAAGSPVPKAIYSDYQLATPMANPMPLDGNGVAPQWFVGDGLVDVKVYDVDNALVFTALNVEAASTSGGTQYPTPTGPGYLYFDGSNYSWSAVASDHKVAITAVATPDYLQNIVIGSASVTVTPVGSQLQLSSPLADDHKVAIDATDLPGYLNSKFTQGSGISIAIVDFGTEKFLQVSSLGYTRPTAAGALGYLNTFFTDSSSVTWTKSDAGLVAAVNPAFLDHKVVTSAFDPTPGYISDKFTNSATIGWVEVVDTERSMQAYAINDSKVKATDDDPAAGVLRDKLYSSDATVIVTPREVSGVTKLDLQAGGKVKYSLGDTAGYLQGKIKAGTGITLSTTVDSSGTTIWVNSKTNAWKPTRVVSAAATYTIQDTDSIVVIDNVLADTGGIANGNPYTQLYFPAASAAYLGRSVTITGTTYESGSQIAAGQNIMTENTTIGWAVGQAIGAHRGMQMRTFTCRPTMSGAVTYNWVDDDFFRNVGAG